MITPAPVTLILGGDVMLGRGINAMVRKAGAAHPWGDLLPLLWNADLFLVNLECAITGRTLPYGGGTAKPFYFRADPELVEVLRIGRVDAVSLANNHAEDFGVMGLTDTIRLLDQAGIAHAGAGGNRSLAAAAAHLRARALRIALVAFADHPREWAAMPFFPGINYAPVTVDPGEFLPVRLAIEAARQAADLVVFSMHWGPNLRERPGAGFRDFAHRVIESGADIFWGHSAHLLQGIEVHDNGLILYDTGDLIDDYATDPLLRNDLSALFSLRLVRGAVERLDVHPIQIRDCQATLARGDNYRRVVQRLGELSAELGTTLLPADWGLTLPLKRLEPVAPAGRS
jgi:poly-gamma-glutamate synthesis protein (capsule biosynthesis protein)